MTSKGDQYFVRAPQSATDEHQIELVLPDIYLQLTTDSGVFSNSRIDPGTRFLLQEIVTDQPTKALDLGCGYGPIALTLAKRLPDADVWGIDVNDRALALARRNATENEVSNAKFVSPGDLPGDLRFDLIVSNPPIRIGKTALHELLSDWLGRLSPSGVALLVVQKHLGSDSLSSWLSTSGWAVERLASRKGYRILEVRPTPGRIS